MKKLCLLMLAACMCMPYPLLSQDLSQQKLVSFTSADGKFTAKFPGKVNTSKRTAKTELGDIQITLNVVGIGNDVAFIVSYNDYPAAVKNNDPKQMLEGVRNGNVGKDGELQKDEAFTFKFGQEQLPGRKVLISKPGGAKMRNMMILRGNRLYQIMFVGTQEHLDKNAKMIEEYFESFQLNK